MARPSKSTPKQWDDAKAAFEADKSFREIDKLTGINYKSVEARAKKEGWKRGVLSQQIADQSRVEANFLTLEPSQKEIVRKEVDERLKHIQFFNNAALKNVSVAVKKINDSTTQVEHKLLAETILRGKETVLGKSPDLVVNNTNAQQNNDSVSVNEYITAREKIINSF